MRVLDHCAKRPNHTIIVHWLEHSLHHLHKHFQMSGQHSPQSLLSTLPWDNQLKSEFGTWVSISTKGSTARQSSSKSNLYQSSFSCNALWEFNRVSEKITVKALDSAFICWTSDVLADSLVLLFLYKEKEKYINIVNKFTYNLWIE